jgi:hypothetical protein
MRTAFGPLLQHIKKAWPIWTVAGSFIISRFIYIYGFDVSFSSGTLLSYWQYLDINLLRHDLLRSVFYLHQQPPLFNLYLGVVIKLFPTQFHTAFNAMYLLMGLAFAITQLRLMQALEVKDSIATVLAALAAALPARLIYENWLFYSYPIAFFLCLSALCLIHFLKQPTFWRGTAFFSLLSLLILIRGIFQLPWMLVFIAILLFYYKPQRTLILKTAAIPLLLVLAVSIKQYLVFDHWTLGHSMMAPNLIARVAIAIPKKTKEKLVNEGVVPPYFFLGTFKNLDHYRPYLPRHPLTYIPALDLEKKTNNAESNFNHIDYLTLSDGYMKGLKNILPKHPEWYWRSFGLTTSYFTPAADPVLGGRRHKKILPLLDGVNRFLLWQTAPGKVAYTLVFGLPVLLAYGLALGLQGLRPSAFSPAVRIQHVAILFMVLNILYVTVVTTSISLMDFARYRMKVDAFYLALFGMLLSAVIELVQQKGSQKAGKLPATRL